eukprot:scaffold11769_cov156-Amphora_coffeaeformis.AAC.1
MMIESIDDNLEGLRRSINAATVNLAMSNLLDEEATQALVWILHTSTSQIYATLNESTSSSQSVSTRPYPLDYSEGEGVQVKSLYLTGTTSQTVNPLVFAHPFVVGPWQENRDPVAYLSSMCAAAMFNLGLAKHQQSLSKTATRATNTNTTLTDAQLLGERAALLEQAVEFYRQSYNLLDQLPFMTPDESVAYIYCAVCNNLAEAAPQEAKEWQKALDACLFAVPPDERSPIYRHLSNASMVYNLDM